MSRAIANMVAKVRSNINEGSTVTQPLRSDAEIRDWLDQSQHDYVARIPADSVTELTATFSATLSPSSLPSDYMKLIAVDVYHTISGTYVETATASILKSNETYLANKWASGMGAFGLIKNNMLLMGPQFIRAELHYIKKPSAIYDANTTFELDIEHEEPVVNRAAALALTKANDEEAPTWMALFDSRVEAEIRKYGPELDVEKEP